MGRIYIGTAGWNVPGAIAEQFSGEGTHLVRYARRMNCAEINSSFHREHRVETYEKWAASVPDHFRFAVKMPRGVTHEGKVRAVTRTTVRHFLEQTSGLGEKRGPVLLQVPPKLSFDAEEASEFFKMFRELYKGAAVFEPRHASWFEEEADGMLGEFKIARAGADPAVVEAAAHPGGWRALVYFRLHGSPRRYYSAYESEYLERIAGELHGATEAWCVFDNTASGAALGNAVELTEMVSGRSR
jgi:uncharacterized protein YecE (DUF72 family)